MAAREHAVMRERGRRVGSISHDALVHDGNTVSTPMVKTPVAAMKLLKKSRLNISSPSLPLPPFPTSAPVSTQARFDAWLGWSFQQEEPFGANPTVGGAPGRDRGGRGGVDHLARSWDYPGSSLGYSIGCGLPGTGGINTQRPTAVSGGRKHGVEQGVSANRGCLSMSPASAFGTSMRRPMTFRDLVPSKAVSNPRVGRTCGEGGGGGRGGAGRGREADDTLCSDGPFRTPPPNKGGGPKHLLWGAQ